jgi:crossover junction endodeoxyribonuclease RusA
MKFTVPYPPSVNRYWGKMRSGRVYLTKEAKDFKDKVKHKYRSAKYDNPTKALVSVKCMIYRPRKIGDIDNIMKALLDSLKGIAYEDDKQIVVLHAERFDDKSNPRVEVWVDEITF